MSRVYGCHNQPRPVAGAVTHQAQAGWGVVLLKGNGCVPVRVPFMVDIRHIMSTDCRYDKSATDPCCRACQYRIFSIATAGGTDDAFSTGDPAGVGV